MLIQTGRKFRRRGNARGNSTTSNIARLQKKSDLFLYSTVLLLTEGEENMCRNKTVKKKDR